ncbi:MAG: hypothetical protein WD757_06825 [Actinomycetota bacterium]
MSVPSTGRQPSNGERPKEFKDWQERRIRELSSDPDLHAQVEEDLRRMERGLEPDGVTLSSEELRRRAHGDR